MQASNSFKSTSQCFLSRVTKCHGNRFYPQMTDYSVISPGSDDSEFHEFYVK